MLFAAIPSDPWVALAVAIGLFALGRQVVRRTAYAEGNPWLVRIMTIGLVLHLLAAPAQLFVTDHLYHGIADWTRYTHQGAILGPEFRHFDFSLAGAQTRQIVNDGAVSIACGIVMAFVGINVLATFLVFSFLSFIGAIFFYRAFTLTFADANHRRYAYIIFLWPSLIYWTADISKEAIMTFALGLTAYGAAKILARQGGGFSLVIPGVAIGFLVRPNELLLVLAGFAVAMMIPNAGVRQNLGGLRRLLSLLVLVTLLGLSIFLTLHYLRGGSGVSLSKTNSNNQGTGLGFGSSGVPYSTNVATYPRDVYEVLFNPLPYNFHGSGEFVAAAENTLLVGLILISLRQLRVVARAAFARPYVMLCLTYSAAFLYAFAALGNLGLIERERTMLLPFLMVLFCIPRAPRGQPPRYEWELKRRARRQLRQALHQADPRPRGGLVPTTGPPTPTAPR